MIRPDEVFSIGWLGAAHGLRGEISLRYTDDIFTSEACDYLVCKIDGLLVPFFVEDWRIRSSETAIIKFEGYDDANAVQILQNTEVFYPKTAAEGQQSELTSWKMLTGFTVNDEQAGEIGTVTAVDDSSANTLLYISSADRGEVILPVHPDLVSSLDINKRTLQLRLPEGLLELNISSIEN